MCGADLGVLRGGIVSERNQQQLVGISIVRIDNKGRTVHLQTYATSGALKTLLMVLTAD